jgi:hypothetical protein
VADHRSRLGTSSGLSEPVLRGLCCARALLVVMGCGQTSVVSLNAEADLSRLPSLALVSGRLPREGSPGREWSGSPFGRPPPAHENAGHVLDGGRRILRIASEHHCDYWLSAGRARPSAVSWLPSHAEDGRAGRSSLPQSSSPCNEYPHISVRRLSQAFGRCLVRRLSLHSRNGVGPGSV